MNEGVLNRFTKETRHTGHVVIVAHVGELRSIVAHITNTPLKESFEVFSFHYGCVVKLVLYEDRFAHEILYNVSLAGKEWHRPTL